MYRTAVSRPIAVACALVLVAAGTALAHPSTLLNTYVLFAKDSMRIRTATVSDGDLGVNDGLLYLRGSVLAGKSDLVSDGLHFDSTTDCEDAFTNVLVGTSGSCPHTPCAGGAGCAGGALVHPLFPDIGEACGFPPGADVACSSDPADDRTIDHDQTIALTPGKYRNLIVEGGGAGPAVLKLSGDYHFCNVRVGRNGSIVFAGPSTVTVAGSARMSNATHVGPDASLGLSAPPPGAIKWFIQGSQVRFSRHGDIGLYACAPDAKMIIGSGVTLTGRFVARAIRLKKGLITFAPPVPGTCGDTVISPGEQCEASTDCAGGGACVNCACGPAPTTTTTIAGATTTTTSTLPGCTTDEDCNPGSPTGTFVCEDGHCVPPSTTTTTTTPTTGHATTTTPTTSTTLSSTTLHPCTATVDCPIGICRDGFCIPECDSNDDCTHSSPTGGFVCVDGRCVPGGEVCGDCIDNDGDGLIDFEDPDCCAAAIGQVYPMDLRKGRFRRRSGTQSLVRLKGALARSALGAKIDPPTQQVTIQVRSQDGGELLCASIPAGKFVKKRKTFRFSRKRTPLPVGVGRNLDRVQIKPLKSGPVRFRVKAKRAELATPAEGTLQITIGFMRPGTSAAQNVCSSGVRLFRGGRKSQLQFP